MFTRVIATTVQYNEEALKMLEMTLKSFYLFNSNFDFKVYCLDNSKELFENYFSKIAVENNFQNLEFINFKDGTKWNSFLERVKSGELTDLEKKNMFENKVDLYVFDTTVCISKLEIVDLLIERYDLVIMSDIDLIFINSIENCIKKFLESNKFMGAFEERKEYFNAGFMLFNKRYKQNLFDSAVNLLKTEDLRKNEKMYNNIDNKKVYFQGFEQDLLNIVIQDFFKINNFIISFVCSEPDMLKYSERLEEFSLIHFISPSFKICHEIKIKNVPFVKNIAIPFRHFYRDCCKIFGIEMTYVKHKFDKNYLLRLKPVLDKKLNFIKNAIEKSKNRV